jgi:hypothetical protein
MTIYNGPAPEGFIFVREPKEATHVYDCDGTIVDLSLPNAMYSRSLRGWMKKLDTVEVAVAKENILNDLKKLFDRLREPIFGNGDFYVGKEQAYNSVAEDLFEIIKKYENS